MKPENTTAASPIAGERSSWTDRATIALIAIVDITGVPTVDTLAAQHAEENMVRISVSETGPGIPHDEVEKNFILTRSGTAG